jgi:hypothetical protein
VGQESICGMINVLSKHFPERTEENHKTVSQDGKPQNHHSGYLQCQQLSQDSK